MTESYSGYDYDDYDYSYVQEKNDILLDELQGKLSAIETQRAKESKLREEYPALQDAWEKYQIVLKTVS